MCITESLCCAPETNTILQINYISIKIKKKKKKGNGNPVQYSSLKIFRRSLVGYSPWGCRESDKTE